MQQFDECMNRLWPNDPQWHRDAGSYYETFLHGLGYELKFTMRSYYNE